jgi:6-phosphofructokinase 1
MKRIGILTGGGDAPGLNAVIRAVVRTAVLQHGLEVYGIENGFDGLLGDHPLRPLHTQDVRGITGRGGTVLGAVNRGNPFQREILRNGEKITVDFSAEVARRVEQEKLDALIVAGGDGTMQISHRFMQECGIPIVGVPKTIDNDLGGTEVTFGFYSALEIATQAIDMLQNTAASHRRVMVVELMGRHAGWLTLRAGIAGNADVILIPEISFDIEKVCAAVQKRAEQGRPQSVIAVAEGAMPKDGTATFIQGTQLGGVGLRVATQIAERTGIETRTTVLGHLQRGVDPNGFDRWLATLYGTQAVQLVIEKKFGYMVNYVAREVGSISIADALAETPKFVNSNGTDVRTAQALGIIFG